MSPLPHVIIAIPAHNSRATLAPTIESAQNQTYPNLAIVIVDNASTDETAEIVAQFAAKDSRIRIKNFPSLTSAEGNFNRALEEGISDGADFVSILHADDVYETTMIDKMVDFFTRHPEINLAFSHAREMDIMGHSRGDRFLPTELQQNSETFLDKKSLSSLLLKYGNFLTCPSACFRVDALSDKSLRWNGETFGSSGDLDLWIRFSQKSPIGFLREPLINYRVSKFSFSVAMSKMRITRHPLFKVLDARLTPATPTDHWNLKFLKAKDDAFLAFNRLRLGLSPTDALDSRHHHLSGLDYVRSLVHSRFHRHFGLRIFAISIIIALVRWPLVGLIVKALIRTKSQT